MKMMISVIRYVNSLKATLVFIIDYLRIHSVPDCENHTEPIKTRWELLVVKTAETCSAFKGLMPLVDIVTACV
jgi:hypothetical protein